MVSSNSGLCFSRFGPILIWASQAAVEVLHSLYGRTCYEIDEFQDVINLMYQTDNLVLLRKLYEWSVVDANGILESKYAISKKLSEVCLLS
jgi:exportin-5